MAEIAVNTKLLCRDYTEALRVQDREGARRAVSEAGRVMSASDILCEIISPAHVRFARDSPTLTALHLANHISVELIARLRDQLPVQRSLDAAVTILTSVETHLVLARIVAEFFSQYGWRVHFLGRTDIGIDLPEFLTKKSARALVIVHPSPEDLSRLRESVSISSYERNWELFLCGERNTRKQLSTVEKELRVRAALADPLALAREASRFVQSRVSADQLDTVLKSLGKRIQGVRKDRGLSQQSLAQASGLDRAYISALENGKQNVTLKAIMRLCNSLGVHFHELLLDVSPDMSPDSNLEKAFGKKDFTQNDVPSNRTGLTP